LLLNSLLVQKLVRELEQDGTLDVLRHGFKLPGVKVEACSFKPDHGMNPDTLEPGERCASTSNRNFEGRQGKGGRTHLVSPQMAAAAAIAGHFVDIRDW